MAFSAHEKMTAAKREVGLRRHVYAKKVAAGTMTSAAAVRQIAVMQEIADDYWRLDNLAKEQAQLEGT